MSKVKLTKEALLLC
uniref:Truncated nucleocapsid protein n=1 Tax=Tomato spotted wilt virus TaxID=3052585 RepID=A7U8D4_TSWV|nr:truncated nucleocapsid protein [Orthotospovirus tomatomaculae]